MNFVSLVDRSVILIIITSSIR